MINVFELNTQLLSHIEPFFGSTNDCDQYILQKFSFKMIVTNLSKDFIGILF